MKGIAEGLRRLRQWVNPKTDSRVRDEIAKENIESIYYLSGVVCVVECLALLSLIPSMLRDFVSCRDSVISVGLCVVFSAVIFLIMRRWRERMGEGEHIGYIRVRVALVSFFVLIVAWGMAASFRHYRVGEQIVTFYIVECCFVCFTSFHPCIGVPSIFSSYLIFWLFLVFHDGADLINPVNYLLFAVIAAVGSVARYQMNVREKSRGIEIRSLNRILSNTVLYDDLTGLKNRYALREDFVTYFDRPLCVVMADIDLFKQFNDTCGHEVGDTVLHQVADALAQVFSGQRCYRYGGDEFLIILPDVTEEIFLLEQVQWEEALGRIQIGDTGEPVKCSSGHVCGVAHTTDELRGLIRAADERLYEEKSRRKKNRR